MSLLGPLGDVLLSPPGPWEAREVLPEFVVSCLAFPDENGKFLLCPVAAAAPAIPTWLGAVRVREMPWVTAKAFVTSFSVPFP